MQKTAKKGRDMKKVFPRAIFIVAILFSSAGFAKDLTHRFGLGLKNNTAENLPSVAGVYFPSVDVAFTGGFGLDTKKDYSKLQAHVGFRKIIFTENNLNFYAGAQLGLVNFENPLDGKQSGFEVLGVFGVEFFFQGLENVGFTFEAGMAANTLKDASVRTVADDPTRAGIIFYF